MMPQRGQTRPRNLGMPQRPQGGGGAFRGDPMNGVGRPMPGVNPRGQVGGGPQPGMKPPDMNGASRGLGYGGMYNKGGYGGKSGAANQAGAEYLSQFNAFQDPNIGGEQPGPLQAGWGGFDSLHGGSGSDSMMATKMNDWLNTMSTGGDRERAMNGIGYFNGGNAFDPASVRGSGQNQFYRQNAQTNQQTGAMSAPGTYQHGAAGMYQPNPDGTPNMNFGGYIGNTTVGADGSAQYNPLAPKGRTRPTRTFGQVMQ